MHVLSPSHYFDLSAFAHAELFSGLECVWEVLDRLESYLIAVADGRIQGHVSPQAYLIHPESISLGPNTIVEPGAYIEGPCILGADCVVRHGAYIRGGVLAGNGVIIGHDTEAKNSIFFDRARAAHFAYVGDSILGNGVNLGAGVRLANLRFDGKEVTIPLAAQKIATGRRKLGAIIGDGAQLGCNSVANPGTLLGMRSLTYPCTNVSGFIAPDEIVKRST